jgi:hypothetical protein
MLQLIVLSCREYSVFNGAGLVPTRVVSLCVLCGSSLATFALKAFDAKLAKVAQSLQRKIYSSRFSG